MGQPDMPLHRSYKDAIRALNSLQSNYATIEAIRKSGNNRSANNIPEMVEWTRRIGYSPTEFNRLNIIHVTGTKGKGSTCAFVQSILKRYKNKDFATASRNSSSSTLASSRSNELEKPHITKVGLYSSPHLKSVRERIRINGKPLTEDLFTKYFFEVWDRLENSESNPSTFPQLSPGLKPAYFKYLTLLSFHVFMSENVDSAIYEVGVGGEFDSTNIIEKPTVTGVSALGIDHTFMLGNTLTDIAWNKSGIFKEGVPAVSVPQLEEGMNELVRRAEERKVKFFKVVPDRDLSDIKLGLAGAFQKENANLAIELAAIHLQKLGFKVDIKDDLPDEFVEGLSSATWPGRCQIIEEPENQITWYLDGAHTKESIEASSQWFTEKLTKSDQTVLLFNQQTRDGEALIKQLHGVVYPKLKFNHVIFTTNLTWSDGYSDDLVSLNISKEEIDNMDVQKALAETWNSLDKASRKHIFHDIETSINFIRSLEGSVDVFVTGSLHLVGGFLVVLDKKDLPN
ncbi:hypothetical protein LJB42_001104 [Komagataella kurtzmanii]|nr:hypothetical protein LJB42_001104 [Komagataella kurtzmanii]